VLRHIKTGTPRVGSATVESARIVQHGEIHGHTLHIDEGFRGRRPSVPAPWGRTSPRSLKLELEPCALEAGCNPLVVYVVLLRGKNGAPSPSANLA